MLSKTKNAVFRILVGVGLLAIMAVAMVNYINSQYRSVVAKEQDCLAITANCLDMYFNTKLVGLKLLAGYPDIRSLEDGRVRQSLVEAARTLGVANVSLYDRNGNLISNCLSYPGNANMPFTVPNGKTFFQKSLAGKMNVSERVVYGNLENAYITMQVPVEEADNVIAVIAAFIPIRDISAALLHKQIPEDQHIFVMDNKGQLIHHPHLADIYPESPAVNEQIASLVYSEKTGIKKIKSFLDDQEKLLIYTDLSNADWRVAKTIPLTTLYTRVLSKSLDDIGFFFLLVVCCVLLYGVWRQAKSHEREREQLKMERMTCVNQLAAGLAHEIRNPLTSIKGFIQLMARRTDKPVTPEHVTIILAEIGRIDSLISEFQMLARPLKEPVFEKVNVRNLLECVSLLMEGQRHNKNISLQLEVPCPNCHVFGDISQLKQVFINLLKNAIEAAPINGNVIVTVSEQQDKVAIAVEDDGNGISSEVIEKLGTPFFTTKENGTGLGLSVCYGIVQNHNGQILVSSQPGKKTVFTVRLQVASQYYV